MFIIYNDECNLYCTLFHSVILFIQIKYAIYCLHRHNLSSGNYNIKNKRKNGRRCNDFMRIIRHT